jgi:S-adenosylmethionine:tRNA ribosyltransferase-isomerase
MPCAERPGSRLLTLDRATGAVAHHAIRALPQLLPRHALLVFNDTRVIPARLFATKPTGGAVELLLTQPLSSTATEQRWRAIGRASKSIKPGPLVLRGGQPITVEQRDEMFVDFRVELSPDAWAALIEREGTLPLPPYIEEARARSGTPIDPAFDRERYQTIFAQHAGAVAAPTASLHFDAALLQALADAGHTHTTLTLHVGLGTFLPLRTDILAEHVMHAERYVVPETAAAALNEARASGRPIVAVGTTVVRTLESIVAADGTFAPGSGETRIFLTPGHAFRAIDGLVTNFHLPRSTLLALVAAFAGVDATLAAYRAAVAERYRFYSYGDAMFIS